MTGRIYKGTGGLYTVRTEEGFTELKARKNILKKGSELRAGDYVLLGDNVIEELLPRKNTLIRPPVSNIDKLLIVIALRNPDPCFYNIDKMIAVAEYHGIEPVLILNKNDYEDLTGVSRIYGELPYRSYFISASEGKGTDAVIKEIKGCTCVLAGVSGVGKSTLLNAIAPELLRETGDVSERLRRGKHTTRCAELFDVCGGTIADTPGFSMLDFERFDFFEKDDLPLTMREFSNYIGLCKYTKCTHTKDEGCAIIEAVKRGDIPKTRHESFCELYDVLKAKKKW